MTERFVEPPLKLLKVPASFAGTWEPEVYSQAVHMLVVLLLKVDFLTAKLFTQLTAAQAEHVRTEIAEINRKGRQHCADVAKTLEQGSALIEDAAIWVKSLPNYTTNQQRTVLLATGMGHEIIQL